MPDIIYGAILSSFSGSSIDFARPIKVSIKTAKAGIKKVVINILINRIIAPGSDHLVNPKSKGLIRSNNI